MGEGGPAIFDICLSVGRNPLMSEGGELGREVGGVKTERSSSGSFGSGSVMYERCRVRVKEGKIEEE